MHRTLRGVVLLAILGVVVVIVVAAASTGGGAVDHADRGDSLTDPALASETVNPAVPDTTPYSSATSTTTRPAAAHNRAVEPPLADAGLDQTVPLGTTVYLDGGGTVAPDGSVVDYDWEIQRPDGSTAAPTCVTDDCVRATFLPSRIGVYDVTLSVTDDSGQTAEDTLYVTVIDSDPPSATLTGPDQLLVGESGSFELRGTAGDAPLSSIAWLVDGDRRAATFVDGPGEWETTLSFDSPGTYAVTGEVTDVIGLTADDDHTVTVEPEDDGPYFDVAITDTNSPLLPGETLTVDAAVKNTGDRRGGQEITAGVTFTGADATADVGPLDAGESEELTLTFDSDGDDAGEHEVTVASENDTATAPVEFRDEGPFFDVTIRDTTSPVTVGNPLEASVRIENTGEERDRQPVALEYRGERRDAVDNVSLEPGETTELDVGWQTGTDDRGTGNVTASSQNDTDRTRVTVAADTNIEVVAISPVEPEAVEEAYRFGIEYENTGDTVAQAYIELAIAGGELLGSTITDEIEPGETAYAPLNDFVWHTGDNGWHEYNGRTVDVRATTGSWEGSRERSIDVPQLPTYELEIDQSNMKIIPSRSEAPVTQVAVLDALITNVGGLPGDATGRFELLESEIGDSTGVRDETVGTIEPGESRVIDQYPRGENELYYNPSSAAEWEDDIAVKVDVYDDLGGVHDSETFNLSWSRSPPSGGGDNPCEVGPQLDVETEPVTATAGEIVSYDVYLLNCADGEEGIVSKRKLSPSEYSVEYAPQSPGPREYMEIRRTSEKVRGHIPGHISRDKIEFGWRVEHHGSDASGYGGAIWYASE